jgi:hypothetical protein
VTDDHGAHALEAGLQPPSPVIDQFFDEPQFESH